mgnify:CR=1 FL=1
MHSKEHIHKIKNKLTQDLSVAELNELRELIFKYELDHYDKDDLVRELNMLKSYTDHKLDIIHQSHHRTLTLINMIFLPLGVIVGYFGMNFANMGNPMSENTTGIMGISHPNSFILLLFVLSISIMSYIYLRYIME